MTRQRRNSILYHPRHLAWMRESAEVLDNLLARDIQAKMLTTEEFNAINSILFNLQMMEYYALDKDKGGGAIARSEAGRKPG